MASAALASGSLPRPMKPLPASGTESRRTNDSRPSWLMTNVPFVLWSMSRNLSRETSILACSREISEPFTTMSFSSARPSVNTFLASSSTCSPPR